MNQSIPKEIDNILDKLHKALHEVTVWLHRKVPPSRKMQI